MSFFSRKVPPGVRRILTMPWTRWRAEAELEDEWRFHIESRAADLRASGMSANDALAEAQRQFGDQTELRHDLLRAQAYRARRRGAIEWLDDVGQDFNFAHRSLRRNLGFACVAACTFALAIGASTAVLTVVNGVLLRPLPFASADRLMTVSYWPSFVKGWLGAPAMMGRDFVSYQKSNRSFDHVALVIPHGAQLTGAIGAATLPGAWVSPDFFAVLGVKPALGRTFARDDGTTTGAGVVVISHKLWQQRFASDSSIVGRMITLDSKLQTVIGVMPEGFDFPNLPAQAPVRGISPFPASEYWLAIAVDPMAMSYPGPVIGRLRSGTTPQQAQVELATMAKSSFLTFAQHQSWCCPLSRRLLSTTAAQVLPLRDIYLSPPSLSPDESRDARTPLLFFTAAVAFVLLIACSNVTALILMRTISRTHEIAIRAALGAPRWRLVQHALIESVCISTAGAVLSVPLAWAGMRLVLHLAPSGVIPLADQVRVDGRVLGLSIAIVLACGILAGLAPAIFAARQSPQATLGRGNRMSQRHPVLEVTTAASMAFALILLTSAALLVQSVLRLQSVHLGFEPTNVLTMRVAPSGSEWRAPAATRRLREQVLVGFAGIPQTTSLGVSTRFLMGASPGFVGSILVEGRDSVSNVVAPDVSPDYFLTLGMPLIAGRTFTRADDHSAPAVAVVNRSFAAKAWPGQSAIGKRIWNEFFAAQPHRVPTSSEWVTVVGIVGDAVEGSIKRTAPPSIYLPIDQDSGFLGMLSSFEFFVRTAGDQAPTMHAMRQVMHDVAPNVPIEVLTPLSSLVATERAQPLFEARLITAFSIVALLLAALGTYSILAYSVAQRRHELAVRIALGAQPANVFRLILLRGATLAVAGVCAGLAGSFALTRALQSMLYQTSATDPRIFSGAAALLLVVAIMACIIPTRRATRVDPVSALREI